MNSIDTAKSLCDTECNPIVDLSHLTWTINNKLPNIGGSYIKASENKDDKLYYYKMSRYMPYHGIIGHESINEIICMNIANSLGLSCARYEIIDAYINIKNKHTLLVRCPDFKPCNTSKISLENYYEICKLNNETTFEFMKRMGYEDFCYRLFIFDYLIFNRDRHGANIEFIYENGKYTLAPLFDNGLSFMCSCITPEEFKAYDKLKTGPVNNYIGSRDTLENLKLVPKSIIDVLDKPDNIFQGLEPYFHYMPQEFWDNIQEMFDRRWELVKSL
ncbi:MAG: HipA domain-containing protein [Lachnospiraceae bacterium]|nr:HipA domain-containing protein [Lachnospiraceae bacterium]